jgi:hypothetical protein
LRTIAPRTTVSNAPLFYERNLMPLSRQRKGTTHPYDTTADDSHFAGHGQILLLEQRVMELRAYNNLAWL